MVLSRIAKFLKGKKKAEKKPESWGRVILSGTAIGLSAAVPILGGLRWHVKSQLAEIAEMYGTLEDSKYGIEKHDKPYPTAREDYLARLPKKSLGQFGGIAQPIITLQENLANLEESLANADKNSPEYENLLIQLEGYIGNLWGFTMDSMVLSNLGMDDPTKQIEKMFGAFKLQKIPFEEQEKKYGPLAGMKDKIFEKLTGKPIPEGLETRLEEIDDEGIAGYHNFRDNSFSFEDLGYEQTLLTNLHELGHVIYQGSEDYMCRLVDFEFLNKGEMKAMEEAAAYLFMIAGTQEVEKEHPQLAQRMRTIIYIQRAGHIEDYRKGSTECHDVGFSLADSLIAHFNGDAADAFNYLMTRNQFENLDEGIIANLEQRRKCGGDVFKESVQLYESLKSRCAELAGQHGVDFAKVFDSYENGASDGEMEEIRKQELAYASEIKRLEESAESRCGRWYPCISEEDRERLRNPPSVDIDDDAKELLKSISGVLEKADNALEGSSSGYNRE